MRQQTASLAGQIGLKRPQMLQEDRSKLDERMMQSVKRASKDSDAMLIIVDASDRPARTLTFLQSTFEEAAVPLAVVLNKARAPFESLPFLHDIYRHMHMQGDL